MDVNQFTELLNEVRSDALDEFAEKTANELKNNIKEMWYDIYEPEEYARTFELLNSVDVKSTKAGRQVYINEASISNGERQGRSGWTEHIGVTGERVDSFADMISENAQGNPKNGNRRISAVGTADTDFFEATNEWVEKNLKQEVTELVVRDLKRYGIRSKVTTGSVANIKGNLQKGIRIKI